MSAFYTSIDILCLSRFPGYYYLPFLKLRRTDDADVDRDTTRDKVLVPRLIEFGDSDLRNARNLPHALF